MTVSKKSVYVGEPLLLQVTFFEPRNSDISQAQYEAPKFDGFFVKSNKNERLQQTPAGTAHIFDYILTPQKEGNFRIVAPRIKIGIQTFAGANDPWGFFNNEVHWRNIIGNPVTIRVKALPHAADLVGSFDMKALVDKKTTQADKPVNYTLTIEGVGSLEDIDDPKFDINGVTVYSDDAKVSSKVVNGEIYSKWLKKYTFIADKDFTIPAVHKTVFDPGTGKISTLSSQAFSVRVMGGSSFNPPAPQTTPSGSSVAHPRHAQSVSPQKVMKKPKENNRSLLEDVEYYKQKEMAGSQSKVPWWTLVLAFLAGIPAGMVLIKWLPKAALAKGSKSHNRKYSAQEALEILYPHTNDSKEIEEMVRRLYSAQKDSSVKIDQKRLRELIATI
jgi:hypothetical protein